MAAEQKGLYDKYIVIKVVDGTVIENCFILRPDKDPAAVKALQAYAAATENKVLANDIYAWVGKPMLKPLTLEEVKQHCEQLHAAPLFFENRKTCCWVYANMDDDELLKGEIASIKDDWLTYERMVYGVNWRCWATRPTEEERAAAPWEE